MKLGIVLIGLSLVAFAKPAPGAGPRAAAERLHAFPRNRAVLGRPPRQRCFARSAVRGGGGVKACAGERQRMLIAVLGNFGRPA